jgi:hypothetical protein
MMPIAYVILGVAAGILSGMFGIGGGVVIVPVLTTFVGFSLSLAVGTSLAALLLPVSLLAVIQYYRAGKLKIGIALPVAIGLVGGAVIGARLALNLPTHILQQLYGLFLIYAGWRFIEPRQWMVQLQKRSHPPVPASDDAGYIQPAWWTLIVLGIGAGVASGMFGIGGGLVIVPALVTLLRFEQKMAVGTSLGALLFPVSFGAVLEYFSNDLLDIQAAVLIALGLLVGAFFGARLALGLPSSTVKRLYGIFLIVIAVRFLFAPAG